MYVFWLTTMSYFELKKSTATKYCVKGSWTFLMDIHHRLEGVCFQGTLLLLLQTVRSFWEPLHRVLTPANQPKCRERSCCHHKQSAKQHEKNMNRIINNCNTFCSNCISFDLMYNMFYHNILWDKFLFLLLCYAWNYFVLKKNIAFTWVTREWNFFLLTYASGCLVGALILMCVPSITPMIPGKPGCPFASKLPFISFISFPVAYNTGWVIKCPFLYKKKMSRNEKRNHIYMYMLCEEAKLLGMF